MVSYREAFSKYGKAKDGKLKEHWDISIDQK